MLRPFTYNDANGDGIITPDEVTPGTGFIYYGYSQPRDIIAITNGFDLFERHLRLSVLIDYKGGYNLNNGSASFYATNFATWSSENLKDTPLWDQARNVAASSAKNPATSIGYYENGSVLAPARSVGGVDAAEAGVGSLALARRADRVLRAQPAHVDELHGRRSGSELRQRRRPELLLDHGSANGVQPQSEPSLLGCRRHRPTTDRD